MAYLAGQKKLQSLEENCYQQGAINTQSSIFGKTQRTAEQAFIVCEVTINLTMLYSNILFLVTLVTLLSP